MVQEGGRVLVMRTGSVGVCMVIGRLLGCFWPEVRVVRYGGGGGRGR